MKKFILLCLGIVLDVVLSLFIIKYMDKTPEIKTPLPQSQMNLNNYFAQKGTPNVLGVSSKKMTFGDLLAEEASKSATPSSSPKPKTTSTKSIPQATTAPTSNLLNASQLTIAVLGDSMVDTLGPDLPHLKSALKKYLPNTSFHLYNFGVGASNIEYGITRLNNSYSYLGQTKSSVLAVHPDILVVESFAYNHWENTKSDLDRHWLSIAKIIGTVKNESPKTKIVLAASIAPYCPTFTQGSANIAEPERWKNCQTVKSYLQNLVNFASSQGFPLANSYHASLNGDAGNPKYINSGDNIHPSDLGKALFSEKVAQAIVKLSK